MIIFFYSNGTVEADNQESSFHRKDFFTDLISLSSSYEIINGNASESKFWSATDNTETVKDQLFILRGNIRLLYNGRFLSDQAGEDNKIVSSGDLVLEAERWPHFRISCSGDYRGDLDDKSSGELDRTITIFDTWGSDTKGFLYSFTAELYDLAWLDFLRIGRQYINNEFTSHIDGISTRFSFLSGRITLFAYGGLPVKFFDDVDSSDSKQGGGGCEVLLPTETRFSFEYQYLDEVSGMYGGLIDGQYEQGALSVKQFIGETGFIGASISLLDGKTRSFKALTSLYFEKSDVEIDSMYYQQLIDVEEVPTSFSPFTAFMGPVKPYQSASITVSKGLFQNNLTISGGYELRQLGSGEEETDFNHSFQHGYVWLLSNISNNGLFNIMLQADIWRDFEADEQEIVTGGGELQYGSSRKIQIRLGGYYSLYKYDYYMDLDETSDVYTVYADGRFNLGPAYLKGRYELEIYDINEHQFQFSVGYQF